MGKNAWLGKYNVSAEEESEKAGGGRDKGIWWKELERINVIDAS